MKIISKFCLRLASTTIAAVCANSPAQAQLKIIIDYYSTRASQPVSVYKTEFKVDSSKNYVQIFLDPAKCEFADISVVLDKKVYPQGHYMYFKPDFYGRPFLLTRDQVEFPKGSYGLKNFLRLHKNTANSYAERKRYMSIVADNAFNGGEPGQAIVLANSRSFEPFKVKLSNLSGYPKVHELMYGDKCPTFIPDCLSRVLHKGLDEYAGLKLLEYSSDKGSATIEVNKKILGEGLLFNTPETGGACDLYKNDLGDRGKNLSRNCRIIYFGSTSNCGQFVEGKDDREKVLFGSEKPAKLIIFTPEVVDLPSPKPAPESIPKPAPDEKTPLMSPKEQCSKKGFIPPLGKLPKRIYCAAKYKEERRYCKIITYMRRQTEVCESELIEQPCCRAYDCSLYNLKCPNPSVAPGRTDRDKGRD